MLVIGLIAFSNSNMGRQVSKNDEFCITNEELCINYEELYQNDEFCSSRAGGREAAARGAKSTT